MLCHIDGDQIVNSTFDVSDDLQKMREKRGLGGLAKIFGDSDGMNSSKVRDLSVDSGGIKDLIKNETIFESS